MNKSANISESEFFNSNSFPNSNSNETNKVDKDSVHSNIYDEMQIEDNIKKQCEKNEKELESLNSQTVSEELNKDEEKTKFNFIRKINHLNDNKLNRQLFKLRNNSEIDRENNFDVCQLNNLSENYDYKKSNFYILNEKGKKVFNIENAIDFLQELDNLSTLSKIVGSLLNEKKTHILESFLEQIGKNKFLAILKKALEIENQGGIIKKESSDKMTDTDTNLSEQRKSAGGVLFHLLKLPENGIDKKFLRDVFRKDYKLYKEKKKLLKVLDKMAI